MMPCFFTNILKFQLRISLFFVKFLNVQVQRIIQEFQSLCLFMEFLDALVQWIIQEFHHLWEFKNPNLGIPTDERTNSIFNGFHNFNGPSPLDGFLQFCIWAFGLWGKKSIWAFGLWSVSTGLVWVASKPNRLFFFLFFLFFLLSFFFSKWVWMASVMLMHLHNSIFSMGFTIHFLQRVPWVPSPLAGYFAMFDFFAFGFLGTRTLAQHRTWGSYAMFDSWVLFLGTQTWVLCNVSYAMIFDLFFCGLTKLNRNCTCKMKTHPDLLLVLLVIWIGPV